MWTRTLRFIIFFVSGSGTRKASHGGDSFTRWRTFEMDSQNTHGSLPAYHKRAPYKPSYCHIQVSYFLSATL